MAITRIPLSKVEQGVSVVAGAAFKVNLSQVNAGWKKRSVSTNGLVCNFSLPCMAAAGLLAHDHCLSLAPTLGFCVSFSR